MFFCGGVLPAVEDYLDELANSKEILKFFNKKDSPEKLKKYIASVNGKLSPAEVSQYSQLIFTYAKAYDVDYKLVAAVIAQESRFNPQAKSSVGALGLMQVMPSTAKGVAKRLKLENYDLLNPRDNVQIGVKYLDMLRSEYDGDCNLILAHYNGGYRQAEIYRKFKYFDLMRLILMKYETYNYVRKVKSNYRRLNREF